MSGGCGCSAHLVLQCWSLWSTPGSQRIHSPWFPPGLSWCRAAEPPRRGLPPGRVRRCGGRWKARPCFHWTEAAGETSNIQQSCDQAAAAGNDIANSWDANSFVLKLNKGRFVNKNKMSPHGERDAIELNMSMECTWMLICKQIPTAGLLAGRSGVEKNVYFSCKKKLIKTLRAGDEKLNLKFALTQILWRIIVFKI